MRIFEWVKSMTGNWGPALLELYFQNAGWLNAILLIYGLLLVLSWQNLSRVSDSLADQILEQAKIRRGSGTVDGKSRTVRLGDFQLSWESALASSRFPFVAGASGLLPRRTNLRSIRALISDRDLIQRCARRMEALGYRLERSK